MSTGVIPIPDNALSTPPPPRSSAAAGALVIGGAHGSLSVVRSLGRRGVPVWVLTNDQLIARFSRYAGRCPQWPADPEIQADRLLDLGERHNLRGWTLFPGGDCEAEMLSQHRYRLAGMYRVTAPPWNILRWAYDKRLSYRLAQDLGIPYPRTWCPAGRSDVETLDCPFPAILKPAMKRRKNEFTLAKAWRVDNRAALLERYDQACSLVDAGEVMIQELIPGSGAAQFSYGALWDGSGPVATLVARRARQYPIDFGYTSTFVLETVDCPEVEETATCLLQAIRYPRARGSGVQVRCARRPLQTARHQRARVDLGRSRRARRNRFHTSCCWPPRDGGFPS